MTSVDIAHMQNLGITQSLTVGWFSLPVPNMNFIGGVMRMLDFKEYNSVLFTGNAEIIYYLLSTISFMVAFSLFIMIISIGVNAIRAR
jgi:preprotein translocase subunit SecE